MKVDVVGIDGKKKESVDVRVPETDKKENEDRNYYLTHKYQSSLLRAGTASVKTRSDVRGGGRKPYKQKGTGRARRGTSRSPLIVGGGVIFGPSPRDFSVRLNKEAIKGALRQAFLRRSSDVIVLDYSKDNVIKTKEFVAFMNSQNVSGRAKVLLVAEEGESVIGMAARNVSTVDIARPNYVPVEALLNCDKIVVTKDAVEKLEGLLK